MRFLAKNELDVSPDEILNYVLLLWITALKLNEMQLEGTCSSFWYQLLHKKITW